MDDKSLPEILREKREEQKVSLTKVWQETYLPEKFINLMENGQWEGFPSKLHLKGYLKIYLKYLRLDPALIQQYKGEIFPGEEEIVEENKEEKSDSPEGRKKYLAIFLFFILFLIVILFFKILP